MHCPLLDINGKYYNLGVVSDKVTADIIDDGAAGGVDFDYDWLSDILAWIISIVLIGLLVVVAVTCFPWLISFVGKILSVAFKWLFSLIALPFKLIGKLFKKK